MFEDTFDDYKTIEDDEDAALFAFVNESIVSDLHDPDDLYDSSRVTIGTRVRHRRKTRHTGIVQGLDHYACVEVKWDSDDGDGIIGYVYPNQIKRE